MTYWGSLRRRTEPRNSQLFVALLFLLVLGTVTTTQAIVYISVSKDKRCEDYAKSLFFCWSCSSGKGSKTLGEPFFEFFFAELQRWC